MKTQQADDTKLYQYWPRGSNEAAGSEVSYVEIDTVLFLLKNNVSLGRG
jgi:hypothetical protein